MSPGGGPYDLRFSFTRTAVDLKALIMGNHPWLDLWRAAVKGDLAGVQSAVAGGADPNVPLNPDQYIDMLDAVTRDAGRFKGPMREIDPVECDRIFQRHRNAGSGQGNFVLPDVAWNHQDIAEWLLSIGARPEVRDLIQGRTLL